MGAYVSMLEASTTQTIAEEPANEPATEVSETTPKDGKRKPKKKRGKARARREGGPKASNKWADQCMYAELLEMSADDPWPSGESANDGLPQDLESGWLAVAPVPVGKRCLAVTHQSSGVAGLGEILSVVCVQDADVL